MSTKRCDRCSARLECSCGTWDRLHEDFCETRGRLCEDCAEQYDIEAQYLAAGYPGDDDEPDPYADHVKDLTVDEIDTLIAAGAAPVTGIDPQELR